MTFDEFLKSQNFNRAARESEDELREAWNAAIMAAVEIAEHGQLYNKREGHVTRWKDSAGVEYTAQHDTAVALRRLLSEPHSTGGG